MTIHQFGNNTRQVVFGLMAYMAMMPTASAGNLIVTDLSDSLSNLNCDAQYTFREALAVARNGETIEWSSALTYPATTMLVGAITIDKNLTINGPGAHKLELNAQDQLRVLAIAPPATTVSISGLSLSHGRVQGANGVTSCSFIGGLICTNGTPGGNAAGGCIHSSVAQLSLSRVNVHHCALVSGSGGNGGSWPDEILNQTIGCAGANGGFKPVN